MRIVIPIFDRFTALDAIGPYEVLRMLPGAEVTFAAKGRGVVRTDSGAVGIAVNARLRDQSARHDRSTQRDLTDAG